MNELSPQYRSRIEALHQQLNIAPSFAQTCKMPLQVEAKDLVSSEADIFDREQRMTGATLACWQNMKAAAQTDGISLQIVSAFRSVEYQCELLKGKLAQGQNIDAILMVNAAPGYSEHHTGRAIDITTEDCEPLHEEFEITAAFKWLQSNGKNFGFSLSYPRDNPLGIVYEPWHWACRGR
jgi:D-alanyl-D-alanine carboxypeptidase|tara:strand:- start:221 stop:760 length:540 start_codon:yes stop_codon:yes gene_type:complete